MNALPSTKISIRGKAIASPIANVSAKMWCRIMNANETQSKIERNTITYFKYSVRVLYVCVIYEKKDTTERTRTFILQFRKLKFYPLNYDRKKC